MSNEDRQLLGPTSQRILRGDKDWANPSLATLVGADPLPTKDRVQGVPDGRSFLSNADSRPAALEEEVRRDNETKQQGDQAMNEYDPKSFGFSVLALPPTCVPTEAEREGLRTRTISVCTGLVPPMSFTVTEYPSNEVTK